MESPTGLMPEDLIDAGMMPAALDYLRAQPWPADFKRQVLAGWGLVTGVTITGAVADSVAASGWDKSWN